MIHIVCESVLKRDIAKLLANNLNVMCVEDYMDTFLDKLKRSADIVYVVVFSDKLTYLMVIDGKEKFRIEVDFVAGGSAHRRKFGGGNGQQIAKAVGLNKGFRPSVLDVTAGLGGDAFVLASLGCNVTMIERSIISRTLLQDGLRRARSFCEGGNESQECDDAELLDIMDRLTLLEGDSLSLLADVSTQMADVVYVDPMFPERKKSALVKKEMRAFHNLIGADDDADGLLDLALSKAEYRVVVKRPKIAPFLANKKPSYQLIGKSSRFDIYTLKALP